jgi:hypothetical protein
MIAYCVHCEVSITDELTIVGGEIVPSKYLQCPNCGKMAGVKEEPAEKNSLSDLAIEKGEMTIKDGRIT